MTRAHPPLVGSLADGVLADAIQIPPRPPISGR